MRKFSVKAKVTNIYIEKRSSSTISILYTRRANLRRGISKTLRRWVPPNAHSCAATLKSAVQDPHPTRTREDTEIVPKSATHVTATGMVSWKAQTDGEDGVPHWLAGLAKLRSKRVSMSPGCISSRRH
jgi:hypothetical protein